MGIQNFRASNGWLEKWKKRHSICYRSVQGEAGKVDKDKLGEWQESVLKSEIARFSPEDVYNADEYGLFWKVLPHKTLAFKGYIFRQT